MDIDTEFSITDIIYSNSDLSYSVSGFSSDVTTYNIDIPYGFGEPAVTYKFSGFKPSTLTVTTTTVSTGVYQTIIANGGTALYTLNFTTTGEKPDTLINSQYKLTNEKDFSVGYLGGSITYGTGASNSETTSWRAITRAWIKDTFPNSNVKDINAAIGGTGVKFGLYRAEEHLFALNDGVAPDLTFIEFAINDYYDGISVDASSSNTIQYVYIESLLQKIYATNSKADVVFVITGDKTRLNNEASVLFSKEFGTAYTDLAEYYNIPILYAGRALKADDLVDEGISSDGVHPTDIGHAHYAQTVIDFLSAELSPAYVPDASDYVDATLPSTYYCTANSHGSLILDADLVAPTGIQNATTETIDNFVITTTMVSTTSGDTLTLEFNAQNIGLWALARSTATNITYSIDGGAEQTLEIYLSADNHKMYDLATNLGDGVHTITITHTDANKLDIRNFYFWGLNESEPELIGITYTNDDFRQIWVERFTDKYFANDFDGGVEEFKAALYTLKTATASADNYDMVYNVIEAYNNLTSNSTKVSPIYHYGDLNGDNSVNVLDLIRAKHVSLGTSSTYAEYTPDINEDGSVNAADLANIKRLILGLGIK